MSPARATSPRMKAAPPLPSAGAAWALFLDVDGTLVGFNDDPDMVEVPAGLQATLTALHDALGGALALVSGRRLYDLDRLFGPPLVAAAGLHGLQRRRNDGSEEDMQPDPDVVDALHRHVAALAARLPHMRVEDKGICIALHYRETPLQEHAVIAGACRIARQLPGYETQAGNHIIEIKPAGVDKGYAVKAFLDEAPFIHRLPVYLGDDLTDEHAFAAVNAHDGISIRVGDREPSRAHYTLRHPSAVQAWLEGVLVHL
ncbi:MAG TPA: trehalose-phosphatase [Oleiagrimonas sp.]|nr:trehalose-phosphatase [Oleiagrimonas sp.]